MGLPLFDHHTSQSKPPQSALGADPFFEAQSLAPSWTVDTWQVDPSPVTEPVPTYVQGPAAQPGRLGASVCSTWCLWMAGICMALGRWGKTAPANLQTTKLLAEMFVGHCCRVGGGLHWSRSKALLGGWMAAVRAVVAPLLCNVSFECFT